MVLLFSVQTIICYLHYFLVLKFKAQFLSFDIKELMCYGIPVLELKLTKWQLH